MSDKTLDLAWQLEQARQQTAELREQLSERDAEVERLRGWMRRISALVVFDGGIGGSPSPAGEEHDLFTRVERLVVKLAAAERERDEAVRSSKFTQDWYGNRWKRMDDWFRSPEMKGTKAAHDWFFIVANGELPQDCPPISFMAEVNMTRYRLQQAERELEAERGRLSNLLTPRPFSEWHEDVGGVLWWRMPICELPYCGDPLCSDWPFEEDMPDLYWTPLDSNNVQRRFDAARKEGAEG